MTTELVASEKADVEERQLITIEPAKYVALVFEPFAKRLADAKALAATVEFDVTTTAGMAVAVKHRATFRDIRVASEKARKERKAPILEIGKLLDGRQKEIEAEIEPFESRFDEAIKAEEKRKDDEKIAKALAESQRITAIRQKIDTIRNAPANWLNRPSFEIASAADQLSEMVMPVEVYAEYVGEAIAERDAAVKQLRIMQETMRVHEYAQAELERRQAELAEQERLAATDRTQQEAKDRAERERVESEQREAQERAAAIMRAEQEAHEARMAARQAEIDAKQAAVDAAAAEQERVAREARQAAEAEERAEAKRIAEEEMVEATRIQAQKDAAEAAELAARQAAEAEAQRRERVQFELNGPDATEMVALIAAHYEVEKETALNWINRWVWAEVEVAA